MGERRPLEVVAMGLLALAIVLMATAYVAGLQGLTVSDQDAANQGVQPHVAVNAERRLVAPRTPITAARTATRAVHKRAKRARVGAGSARPKKASPTSTASVRAQPVSFSPPAQPPAATNAPTAQSTPAPTVRKPPRRTAPKTPAPAPPKTPAPAPAEATAPAPAPAPAAPPVSAPDPRGGDDGSEPPDQSGKDGGGHKDHGGGDKGDGGAGKDHGDGDGGGDD
jgi:hypothetical protein